MAAPGVLALSLSSEATKIGAIAGLVAILGIALLSVLLFAQARELKRLREWAGRAPERAREVEEQAARAASGTAGGSPVVGARAQPPPSVTPAVPVEKPAPPAGTRPPAASAPAPPPAPSAAASSVPLALAGAGVGAPPLLSATRFRGLVPPPAPASPVAPAPDPAPSALTRAPAPSRAVSSGNGHGEIPPSRPPTAPATAAGAARAAAPTPPPRTRPLAPAQATGGGTDSRSAPPAGASGRRPMAAVLVIAALLGVAALTFGAIQLLSSGADTPTKPRRAAVGATPTTPVGKGRNAAPFSNGSVTVAVLNGTPVAGLAKRLADQLVARGFKQGTVTNASEQTRSATLVSFLPGRKQAGTVVAKTLKAVALAPIDPTTRAIACPGAQPCPDVVVTVGADRAG